MVKLCLFTMFDGQFVHPTKQFLAALRRTVRLHRDGQEEAVTAHPGTAKPCGKCKNTAGEWMFTYQKWWIFHSCLVDVPLYNPIIIQSVIVIILVGGGPTGFDPSPWFMMFQKQTPFKQAKKDLECMEHSSRFKLPVSRRNGFQPASTNSAVHWGSSFKNIEDE